MFTFDLPALHINKVVAESVIGMDPGVESKLMSKEA